MVNFSQVIFWQIEAFSESSLTSKRETNNIR